MADRRNNKKPINEQLWVRILCGFLGILMALGTLFYVLSTLELGAANESADIEREIAVGIAYGNDLLPTYTVSAENGFNISVSSGKKQTKPFEINSNKISAAVNDHLYKTNAGYEADQNRVTVIGGYHIQISSYSFRIGSDSDLDNPVSIGGSGGGSLDSRGYTYDEVVSKINDLDESEILDPLGLYSYPVYNDGKYFIRVGNFDTLEKAQEFRKRLSENISMVSEISEPKDGSISLIDHVDNKILLAFFLGKEDRLSVEPKNADLFSDYKSNEYYGHVDFSFSDGKLAVINHLLLEQYIKCILPITVSESSDPELLKLFAVILRTKVLYNSEFHKEHGIDVCTDNHCSHYYGKELENTAANEAVEMTKGEIITYSQKAISPVYCMATGSTTASCIDVFGKDAPYLKAVSNADKTTSEWTYTMSPGDIYDAISNAGYTEIIANISSVTVNSLGEGSQYVNSVTFTDILGNKLTVQGGDAIYKALGCKLPSVAFAVGKSGERIEREIYQNGQLLKETIVLDGVYGEFVFVGQGIGNGLGVSIQGATDDISGGMNYKDVITKYYRDVNITKLS